MMRLLNLYFNRKVVQHRKMFLWHLGEFKRKLMIVIMKFWIKLLLLALIGRKEHVPH